ncbi:MAG: hypothetical protein V4546_04595 [Bacteroidota bacterium]
MLKKLLLSFTLIILLVLNGDNTLAATGCFVTGGPSPGVYYSSSVYNSGTLYRDNTRYGSLSQCQSGLSASNSYYSITSYGGGCKAPYDGSGTLTNSSNYMYSGTIVQFNVLNCPIDGFTPFIMFAMGSIGFFFLRKNFLYANY